MRKLPIPSKKEIIEKMKLVSNRTQLQRKYGFFYLHAMKQGLLDKYLPKVEYFSNSTGELTTKMFLENLFGKKFINCRPKWLVNPDTGKSLELDGYCEELSIAFEYGSHVRIKSFFSQEKRNYVKYKDEVKKQICKQKKIKLIQIKEEIFDKKNPEESLKNQLSSEFKRLKIPFANKIQKTKLKIISPTASLYTKKIIWDLAKKYDRISQFEKNHSGAYDCARRLGILKQIQIYFRKKNDTEPWTEREIVQFVNKNCTTLKDFYSKNAGAYKAAIRLKIFDKVSKKLKRRQRPLGYWNNDENLILAINECNSWTEMKNKYSGALEAMGRRKKYYLINGKFKKPSSKFA